MKVIGVRRCDVVDPQIWLFHFQNSPDPHYLFYFAVLSAIDVVASWIIILRLYIVDDFPIHDLWWVKVGSSHPTDLQVMPGDNR